MHQLNIKVVPKEALPEAQDYLFHMVECLFEKKRNRQTHYDIFECYDFYLENPEHILIGAYIENRLVGTVALKTFVDRFECLKGRYKTKTAEVGRCYIHPEYRRKGIGSKLFSAVLEEAKALSYDMLYLHTHPNLPGGYDFWLKTGFEIVCVEKGNPDTIHMEMCIKSVRARVNKTDE
jgi:GNAT superfamily N-acetyltransferase